MVPEGNKRSGCVRKLDDGENEKKHKMDGCKTRQCSAILNKLMTHPAGWLFNQPVDPVKLNIPDYFSIISRPMDLGTIKSKLEKRSYSHTDDFVADVKLTFSNAMQYNPPHNEVHLIAKELYNIFCLRWKSLDSKWKQDNVTTSEPPVPKKKQKLTTTSKKIFLKTPSLSSSANKSTLSSEKQKLRKDLAQLSNKSMPPHLVTFLCKFGSQGQHRDSIEVDIDAFDEKTVRELQKIVKGCLDERSAELSSSPTDVKRSRGLGSQQNLFKGKANCKKAMCGNAKDNLDSSRSVCKDFRTSPTNDLTNASSNVTSSGTLSSSKNRTCRGSGLDYDCLASKETNMGNGRSTDTDIDGSLNYTLDEQLSPSKALRAARLRSRFASTIVKAQQKTLLNHGGKEDHDKLQKLKKQLEKQQHEEKAKIEAQLRAAEASARRAEAELRMQRQKEREAARIALQKMEKTVDIDENRDILKELEMLENSQLNDDQLISFGSITRTNRSTMNLLECLGLFMKNDDLEDDDFD